MSALRRPDLPHTLLRTPFPFCAQFLSTFTSSEATSGGRARKTCRAGSSPSSTPPHEHSGWFWPACLDSTPRAPRPSVGVAPHHRRRHGLHHRDLAPPSHLCLVIAWVAALASPRAGTGLVAAAAAVAAPAAAVVPTKTKVSFRTLVKLAWKPKGLAATRPGRIKPRRVRCRTRIPHIPMDSSRWARMDAVVVTAGCPDGQAWQSTWQAENLSRFASRAPAEDQGGKFAPRGFSRVTGNRSCLM